MAASTNGEVGSLETSSRTTFCGADADSAASSDGEGMGLTGISFGTLAAGISSNSNDILPWFVESVPRLRVVLDMMFKPLFCLFCALI